MIRLNYNDFMVRRARRPAVPTRERILAAARTLFAHHGFEGASTHEIAARAHASQGLVRHHFTDKEGLWREIVVSGLSSLRQCVSAQRDGSGSELRAEIAALVRAFDEQTELLKLLLHALLEPGPRRDWLLAQQLAPVWSDALTRLGREPAATRAAADDKLLAMWLAAALALPCFGDALAAFGPRAPSGDSASAPLAALEQWLRDRPLLLPAGPWSLTAAARRAAFARLG